MIEKILFLVNFFFERLDYKGVEHLDPSVLGTLFKYIQ